MREAVFRPFLDEQSTPIDSGIVLFFKAPASYTGEDVVELQGHGGPAILDVLLRRVLELGARLARPGEFTERAFLNGKMDLAQAESVSDLISSGSEAAARAAVRSLDGQFSDKVSDITEELIGLRVYVEAALDFAEEEIDFLSSTELTERAASLQEKFQRLDREVQQGQLLRDGLTVVIAGAPNAGKSSLLNQLSGTDTAIVTDVAGTTRDVLREHIQIDGMPLHIIDTAGLHESEDPIEKEGIRRALAALERADHVLWIVDGTQQRLDEKSLVHNIPQNLLEKLPDDIHFDIVVNKTDLLDKNPGIELNHSKDTSTSSDAFSIIHLSAKTGEGISILSTHLKSVAGFSDSNSGQFIARRRHLDALRRASASIKLGLAQLQKQNNAELAAEDFRSAQASLGEITGEFTDDDLLGRIFAGFCIGK